MLVNSQVYVAGRYSDSKSVRADYETRLHAGELYISTPNKDESISTKGNRGVLQRVVISLVN